MSDTAIRATIATIGATTASACGVLLASGAFGPTGTAVIMAVLAASTTLTSIASPSVVKGLATKGDTA